MGVQVDIALGENMVLMGAQRRYIPLVEDLYVRPRSDDNSHNSSGTNAN